MIHFILQKMHSMMHFAFLTLHVLNKLHFSPVTRSPGDNSNVSRIFKELLIAASGSFFLGFAGLFLSLIVGIYV